MNSCSRYILLLLCGLLCAAPARPALSHETDCRACAPFGAGPLYMFSNAPFQLVRFTYIHESPRVVPAGSWRLITGFSWANTWAQSDGKRGTFMFDGEHLTVTMLARYAFWQGIEVGFAAPWSYMGGGVLDGFIEGFHRTAGIGMMRRDDFPRDKLNMEITKDGNRMVLAEEHDLIRLRQVYADVKYQIFDEHVPMPLALKIMLKIPVDTAAATRTMTGSDVAWGVSTLIPLTHTIHWTTSVSAIYFENNQLGSISFSPTQYTVMQAVDIRIGRGAFLIQAQRFSPVTTNLGMDLDHPIIEVMLGYKWFVSETLFFEFGLIENVLHFENSADFGIHTAVGMRL